RRSCASGERPSPPARRGCRRSCRTGRGATGSTRGSCKTEVVASTTSRNLGRISEIAQVAVRHGFGYFFETHRWTARLPGRPKLDPEAESPSERGRHLREMLDELGPTFVKFGQLLSTRPDVVPPDIVAELQKLQDSVTPFPYEDVERVIREELELSVEQLFTDFE